MKNSSNRRSLGWSWADACCVIASAAIPAENPEVARARIDKPIIVVEHPEDTSLRAIEGYLPDGTRLRRS